MRSKVIEKLPTTKGKNHFVEVQVYYDLGGMCYATYKQKARGYYLSATPVEEESRDSGFLVRKFGLFSGICTLLEAAPRFSQAKLDELAAGAKSREVYAKLIADVLAQNGLTLAEVVEVKGGNGEV